jgi:hypothetical protein
MKHSSSDPSTEAEVVMKALEQAPQPLTAKQLSRMLTGPFKLPEEKLANVLEEEASKGRIHRYASAGKGKQPRYWTRDPEMYAREMILTILEERPHKQSDLLKRLKTKLAGFKQAQQKELLARLVEENQIQLLPPFIGTRIKLYSARSLDPRDYIDDAIAKLCKTIGVSREQILSVMRRVSQTREMAAPQHDLGERLMGRMVQVKLAAVEGGLVPLSQLWHSFRNEGWDKASFDRTVLHLAQNYRVALQRHNFPASLSEEERSELVADELGNYYVGITLR